MSRELVGVGEPHAACLTESRAREPVGSLVQEIRVRFASFPLQGKVAPISRSPFSPPRYDPRPLGEQSIAAGYRSKRQSRALDNDGRSRINTGDRALPKNTSGDAFGVPRLCCLLRCLLTSFLQFSWLPSSLASLLLLSWLPFFLFSLCRVDIERCNRYFAVNECIESRKNSVKKKIAFGEDHLTNRNR
jgi:hypothetical protein